MSTTETLPEMIEAALAELLHAHVMLGMATARCMPTPDMPEVLAASKALTSVCNAIRAALAQPAASGEPAEPLHDDAYLRGVALGFPQGDTRRWTLCRIADRIEAATAQPAPARVPQWQPIATAPKDGTSVLLCKAISADGEPIDWSDDLHTAQVFVQVAAWWAGDEAWIVYCSQIAEPRLHFEPTHWMPLPAAPGAPDAGPVQ